MSILSISLTPDLEKFIEAEIKSGEFQSKGQIVKRALKKFQEDLAVERILRAERDVKNGKILRGDLRDLSKKID